MYVINESFACVYLAGAERFGSAERVPAVQVGGERGEPTPAQLRSSASPRLPVPPLGAHLPPAHTARLQVGCLAPQIIRESLYI